MRRLLAALLLVPILGATVPSAGSADPHEGPESMPVYRWTCFWGHSDLFPLDGGEHVQLRVKTCGQGKTIVVTTWYRVVRRAWVDGKWTEEEVKPWYAVDGRLYGLDGTGMASSRKGDAPFHEHAQ